MSQFKKNVKIMLLVTISIKILGFFYKILLGRYLSFEVLQTISLLNPIINLSLVLSSMSIPVVVSKNVSQSFSNKSISNRKTISSAIKITLISTTIIILIFMSFSYFIANNIYQNKNLFLPIIIMLPLLYFSNISGIMKSYLESHNNFKIPIISNLFEQIVKFILVILIIIFFKNKNTIIIVSLISLTLLICEMVSWSFLIFNIKKITKLKIVKTSTNEDLSILKPSFYLTLFQLVLCLSSFLEPIIYFFLTKHIYINQEQTNFIYTSLHSFILPFIQIGTFLTYISIKLLFPKIAKENDNKKISYLIKYTAYILLFIELIMLNISLFHSEYILDLLYKKSQAHIILKSMAIVNLIVFISPILTMTLQAKGYEKNLLVSTIVSSILSLITLGITALIKETAIYSIIISLLAKELIYQFINLYILIKNKLIKIKIKSLLILFISFLLTILISLVIKSNNQLFEIIIESSLIAISYFLAYKYLKSSLK